MSHTFATPKISPAINPWPAAPRANTNSSPFSDIILRTLRGAILRASWLSTRSPTVTRDRSRAKLLAGSRPPVRIEHPVAAAQLTDSGNANKGRSAKFRDRVPYIFQARLLAKITTPYPIFTRFTSGIYRKEPVHDYDRAPGWVFCCCFAFRCPYGPAPRSAEFKT